MFKVSDGELSDMEARASRAEPEPVGFQRIPGYGAEDDGGGGPPPDPGPAPMPAPSMALAPIPVPPGPSDGAAAAGAGKALLWVTAGLVVGALAGGSMGAAAGVVGVGAARNVLRVRSLWSSPNPSDRSEAGKSATMAIFGIGIAGMLGYHAYQQKQKDGFPW